MKYPNHYTHIAAGIRRIREAANRAFCEMCHGGQSNKSTFYSTREARYNRGENVS